MCAADFEEFVTIVSGVPRSGTSLMMSMLQAGGIPLLTDSVREADEDNRRGYFEYEPVKKMAGDAAWMSKARGKAVKIILTLLQHLPNHVPCRIVLMHRHLDEVIDSQQVMLQRAGRQGGRLTRERLRTLYEAEYRKMKAFLENRPNCGCIDISYNNLLADPPPPVRKINVFLGGGLDESAMLSMIDPALYRQRAERAASDRREEASP